MSGNQALGFAIRAVNEAGSVLKDVAGDITNIGAAADGLGKSLDTATNILGGLGPVFGDQVGQIDEYGQAAEAVHVAIESAIKDGPALFRFLTQIPAMLGPAIAQTWAYVTALYAQAAAFIVANAPIILIIGGIALLAAGIVLLITHWDTITEKVPILGQAFDAAKDVVLDVKDKVVGAFQAVVDFLKDHWPEIAVLISGPFAPIVLLATDAFGVRSALTGAFKSVLDFIRGLPGEAMEVATGFGKALADGIASGFGAIVDKTGDLGGMVINAFRSAWNSAIQFADDNFKVHIPGLSVAGKTIIPDVDWNPDLSFLRLATGGIVTKPTFALIGEAGPEAVVPLSGPNAPRGMGETHVHIHGDVYGVDGLIYTIDRALKRSGQSGLVA